MTFSEVRGKGIFVGSLWEGIFLVAGIPIKPALWEHGIVTRQDTERALRECSTDISRMSL